jgi:hypothetical protein
VYPSQSHARGASRTVALELFDDHGGNFTIDDDDRSLALGAPWRPLPLRANAGR